MEKEILKKPVCIVLDTNIWRKNLLLRTGLGSAFLYTVNRGKYKIGLPEIIEDEVVLHTENAAKEAIEKIDKSFRELQSVMGTHSKYTLPNDKQISESIISRFSELEELIVRIPFTLEHARSALHRVTHKLPPSSMKNQQFKDSAIWEALLYLAKSHNIFFVTQDSDFFENKEKKKLHTKLQEEINIEEVIIEIFSDLGACLNELEENRPDEDTKMITNKIFEYIKNYVSTDIATNNLRLTDVFKYNIRTFITQNHNELAVEYSIIVDAMNTDTNELNDGESATVQVEGSCIFNIKKQLIEDNRYSSLSCNWVDTNGQNKTSGTVYASTAISFRGVPDIHYTTRQEI